MQLNKICSNCSSDAHSILHNVRHRGIFRRLCTTCVLRLHPHSFCPSCFTVYNSPQSSNISSNSITCVKCYSATHSSCVGGGLQRGYVCALCANPSGPVLEMRRGREGGLSVDKRGAKVLVAAAMISSVSMCEAEVAARAVAERRAKEAAATRKRATQALDYMAALAAREKMKKNEGLRFVGNVGSGVVEKRYRGGNGGIEGEKEVAGVVVDRSSNEVVKHSLNGVEFRENGRLGGVTPQGSAVNQSLNGVEFRENGRLGGVTRQGSGVLEVFNSDGVATGVDEQSLGDGLEFRDLAVEGLDGGVLNEWSGNPGKVQGDDALRETVNNSVVLHPPKVDWMEGVENSNPGGKNENGQAKDVVDELRGRSSGSGLELTDSAAQDHDGGVLNERSGNSAIIQDEDALRESVNNSEASNAAKEDWMEGVESSTSGMQIVKITDPGKNENGVTSDRRGIHSGIGLEVRNSAVQDHNGGVLNDVSVDSANIVDENSLLETVNNSVVSNPPKEDWMEGVECSNPGMQDVESAGPGKNENGQQK